MRPCCQPCRRPHRPPPAHRLPAPNDDLPGHPPLSARTEDELLLFCPPRSSSNCALDADHITVRIALHRHVDSWPRTMIYRALLLCQHARRMDFCYSDPLNRAAVAPSSPTTLPSALPSAGTSTPGPERCFSEPSSSVGAHRGWTFVILSPSTKQQLCPCRRPRRRPHHPLPACRLTAPNNDLPSFSPLAASTEDGLLLFCSPRPSSNCALAAHHVAVCIALRQHVNSWPRTMICRALLLCRRAWRMDF